MLFEYMMGRETKVCSSHDPAHVWPVDMHCFITMTDTRTMHECVSRCISMTASVISLDCYITLLEGYFNVMTERNLLVSRRIVA